MSSEFYSYKGSPGYTIDTQAQPYNPHEQQMYQREDGTWYIGPRQDELFYSPEGEVGQHSTDRLPSVGNVDYDAFGERIKGPEDMVIIKNGRCNPDYPLIQPPTKE